MLQYRNIYKRNGDEIMKNKIFLLCAFLVLVTLGCSESNEPKKPDLLPVPTVNDAPFTFLKAGNEWMYNWHIEGQSFYDATTIKVVTIDNSGYFRMIEQWYPSGDELPSEEYYYYYESATDDYWGSVFHPIDDSMRIILYKNCYVGQKWNFDSHFSPNKPVTITVEVLSVSDTVVVPAGTFSDCIKVRHSVVSEDWEEYLWYRKDIGLIKTETEKNLLGYLGFGGVAIMELSSKNF